MLPGFAIDVDAVDQTTALDWAVCAAAVLQPYPFDLAREVLVQHYVVRDDLAVLRWRKLCAPLHPDRPRGQPVFAKVVVDGVVAHPIVGLVRGVRDGGVDLAHQQGLAGVQSGGSRVGWHVVMPGSVQIVYPMWVDVFFEKAKFFAFLLSHLLSHTDRPGLGFVFFRIFSSTDRIGLSCSRLNSLG